MTSKPPDGSTSEEAMSRLLAFLARLALALFKPEVHIKFRKGEVMLVTVEQYYRPDTLPGSSRKTGGSQ